jgi:hypothetical protein
VQHLSRQRVFLKSAEVAAPWLSSMMISERAQISFRSRKLLACPEMPLPFMPTQRQSFPPAWRVTRLLNSHCSIRRA